VSFWKENPVFRGVVYTLVAMAIVAFLLHRRHPSAAPADADRPAVAPASSLVPAQVAAAPRYKNSNEVLASCAPELKETPTAPTFEVDEHYSRAGVQMKVRFMVDGNGFVSNPYLQTTTVVTSQDQEAAMDYLRHLSFVVPNAEECRALKIPMVGLFQMSRDSAGEWITLFNAHPVYSFIGNQLAVNPV
jgi:hypothetical protein